MITVAPQPGLQEGLNRVPCKACAQTPRQFRASCHECDGLGYIEMFVKPKRCTGKYPRCPIEYEPGPGGWMCGKCGRSGPL